VAMIEQDQQERLNAEWAAMQEQVKARGADEESLRRAQRWVLVHAFGDTPKFWFDPRFHAQVTAAEQMLDRLKDLAK
jgi:hypothetical protein